LHPRHEGYIEMNGRFHASATLCPENILIDLRAVLDVVLMSSTSIYPVLQAMDLGDLILLVRATELFVPISQRKHISHQRHKIIQFYITKNETFRSKSA
jgi:hypothetical protein